MRVRFLAALLGSMALIGAGSAQAVIEKAVYVDETIGFGWQNPEAGLALRDHFQTKDYTVVDATQLGEWMQKQVTEGDTSVVIFSTDLIPETVMDPAANTDAEAAYNSLFNQYLRAGGKVIYLGDWPAYYLAGLDASRTTWNDTGAAMALGFWPSVWGYTDYNAAPVFTDEGKAWGLTKGWPSLRATPNVQIDIPLGHPEGHPDAAMPWVKMYAGRPGSGLIYMYDRPTVADQYAAEDLAQIQAVAEYFPAGEVAISGTISGTYKNTLGEVVPNQKVRVLGPNGIVMSAITNEEGQFSFRAMPGAYTVGLGGVPAGHPTSANVTVTAGQTAAANLTAATSIDLSSDAIGPWQILLPTEDDAADATSERANAIAAMPDTAFQDINVPQNWDDLNADENIYGWYRKRVTLTADQQNKDLFLTGWQLDDEDWTFWNGQLIGHTNSWNTTRGYYIPASNVKAENWIVVLARDGTGGGGFNQSPPRAEILRSGGTVSGVITDQAGRPLSGVSVTATGTGEFGPQAVTAVTDAQGRYTLLGLGAGSFSVLTTGGIAGTVHPAATTANVTVGGNFTGNITVQVPPVLSLRSADLAAANQPGWSFLQTTAEDASLFGDPTAPDETFLNQWCSASLPTTGASTLVPGSTWLQNWTLVPGDAGEPGRLGEPHGIPDNSWWVQSLRFTLPAGWDVTQAATLADFNIDDNLELACINGVRIGGEPVGQWNRNWSLPIPANTLKAGENLLTIVGFEGGGGAGHNIDLGGPRIIGTGTGSGPIADGDVTGDNAVDLKDATLALQIAVGNQQATPAQTGKGDVIKDGVIDLKDVTRILAIAVGLLPRPTQ